MQKLQHNMRWFVLVICLVLAGCAPKTTVVLVPDPLGKVGIVEVSNDAGSVTMKKAREATKVSGRDQEPSKTQILSKDQINRRFAEVIAIQPKQPIHFILQFETDSTELTPESKAILPSIVTTIRTNNSQDISSIGHSDTAGNPEYNLKLSQQRAEDVARLLIEAGVNPDSIEATSHGENNPLIRTDDNVSEPRNRRVEVVVR
jgi:outer membrane protein OmpA-like peptidoglycan-associated protein